MDWLQEPDAAEWAGPGRTTLSTTTAYDGIHYWSRFDNDELCIALFDRADGKLDLVSESGPIDKAWVKPTLVRRGYALLDL